MTIKFSKSICIILCTLATICRTLFSATAAAVCPEWCECTEFSRDQLYATCEWPFIPDSQVFLSFPADTVTRLSIKCNDSAPSGQLTAAAPRSRFAPKMFEKFRQLRHLTVDNCWPQFAKIPKDFAYGLKQLKSLHLSHLSQTANSAANPVASSAMITFEKGSLSGLESLEKLIVTENDANFFASQKLADNNLLRELCELRNLKFLNLSANGLTSFDDYCTVENQIVILDLEQNRLNRFPSERILYQYRGLRILRMSENNVTEIPVRFFKHSSKLTELYLANNRITLLGDLPNNLLLLDLSNNRLRTIPNVIYNCINLHKLNLSHNLLNMKKDSQQFRFHQNFSQLDTIDLSFNNLHTIRANFFGKLPALRQLYLQNNNLTHLESGSFQNLTSLHILNVSNNRLSSSSDSLKRKNFEGLTNLHEFYMANNEIEQLDGDFFAPILHLKILDLSENRFNDVPAALFLLSELEQLNMSKNRLQKIRKFLLDKLKNLHIIDFSNNRLKSSSFDDQLFDQLTELIHLDFSDNQIESIPPNLFDRLNRLEHLNLKNNRLKSIDRYSLVNLNALNILDVSGNQLETISLQDLPKNLHTLTAKNNQIKLINKKIDDAAAVGADQEKSIDRVTNLHTKLKLLDMSYNKLIELNKNSSIPDSVEFAYFDHNLITDIENDTFFNKTGLIQLDLTFNNLRQINRHGLLQRQQHLAGAESRYSVKLAHNPLVCNCRLKWLKAERFQIHMGARFSHDGAQFSHATVQFPTVIDFDQLTCTSAMLQDNKVYALSDVPDDQFLCPYQILCLEACPCCDFDVCDCKNVCPPRDPYQCQCYHDDKHTVNLVTCRNYKSIDNTKLIDNSIKSIDNRSSSASIEFFKSLPMYSSVIRLDGSFTPHLPRNAFFGRYRLKKLYLNHSSVMQISSNAFSGLTSLDYLDLSDNSIEGLYGDEFFNTPKLETLHLHKNRITYVAQGAFENLPGLKHLTLHQNRLQILPESIVDLGPRLLSLTLANNEWKCDCNEKYELQTWLPKNQLTVLDNRLVYCFENLSQSEDNATILAVLPPSSSSFKTDDQSRDPIVKVNFWTFVEEIDKLFCRQGGEKSISIFSTPSDNTTAVTDQGESDHDVTFDFLTQVWLIFAVSVGFSSLLLIAIFMIVRRRLYKSMKNGGGNDLSSSITNSNSSASRNRRILHDRYSPEAKNLHISQLNQMSASPNPSNGTVINPERNSLLQCKLFLVYSKMDESFVMEEMLARLERLYPYYHQICLLHRDITTNIGQAQCQGEYAADHHFDRQVQEALTTIDRSLHVVLLLTKHSMQDKLIATLFSYLATGPNNSKNFSNYSVTGPNNSNKRFYHKNTNGNNNSHIVILLDHQVIRPHQVPSNSCILYYSDELFWSKFIGIVDQDNENQCDMAPVDMKDDSSSAYGSIIVPSLFV